MIRGKSILFLGISLIGMIGVTIIGGTDVEAKSKTPVYKVTSKKQIKKVQKKVYVRYKKNLPTKLTGKFKYGVASYIRSKEMKANKIHYVRGLNTDTLSSKKSIKAFKRELKYLTLLIRDMDKVYAHVLAKKDTLTYESTIFGDAPDGNGKMVIGTETKHYYEGVSDSEIKADVLGEYLNNAILYKRSYGKDNPKGFEKLYKGTYKGNCHYQTDICSAVAKAWGFKVVTYNTGDEKFKNKTPERFDEESLKYMYGLQKVHFALSKIKYDESTYGGTK